MLPGSAPGGPGGQRVAATRKVPPQTRFANALSCSISSLLPVSALNGEQATGIRLL